VAGDDGRQTPGEPVDMMSRFREPQADVAGSGVNSTPPKGFLSRSHRFFKFCPNCFCLEFPTCLHRIVAAVFVRRWPQAGHRPMQRQGRTPARALRYPAPQPRARSGRCWPRCVPSLSSQTSVPPIVQGESLLGVVGGETCWRSRQQVSGSKRSPQNCQTPGANPSTW